METQQERKSIHKEVVVSSVDRADQTQPIQKKISWIIRILWVSFWIFAVWYIVSYQLPLVKQELLPPQ